MHDANIRVAIAGAGGRMGRQLIQAALALEGVQLGAALEREGSSLLGSDAGELAGAGKTGVVAQQCVDRIRCECGRNNRLERGAFCIPQYDDGEYSPAIGEMVRCGDRFSGCGGALLSLYGCDETLSSIESVN